MLSDGAISFVLKAGKVNLLPSLIQYATSMSTYLDHNAGAPLRPEAKVAIDRAIHADAGNPASVHRAGQSARRMLETARVHVATLIGAEPRQIIFTSGGTEANNLAIFGSLKAHP